MDGQTDPEFLKNEEYGDASGLDVRTRIQERYRTHPQEWFHWVFDRIELHAGAWLLELGSGPGDLWQKNLARLQPGLQLTLTDLSQGMLKEAQQRLAASPEQFSYAALDVQALPFEQACFDGVIGIGLMDHVSQRATALAEVRRVLKPGGRFYASAGGATHLQEIEALVRPFLPDANYGGDPDRFGLENGSGLLSPWFGHVSLHHYQDELVFSQPGPIIAYVLSEAQAREQLAGEKLEAFRRSIQSELQERGEIRVGVEKGLFVATA